MKQSPVILDLCLRKTWTGKSHKYRDFILLFYLSHFALFVFEKLRFQCFHTKPKANVFKFLWFKVCFEKLRFRGGLVWTVGLTVELKLRFEISRVVWTGPSVKDTAASAIQIRG